METDRTCRSAWTCGATPFLLRLLAAGKLSS